VPRRPPPGPLPRPPAARAPQRLRAPPSPQRRPGPSLQPRSLPRHRPSVPARAAALAPATRQMPYWWRKEGPWPHPPGEGGQSRGGNEARGLPAGDECPSGLSCERRAGPEQETHQTGHDQPAGEPGDDQQRGQHCAGYGDGLPGPSVVAVLCHSPAPVVTNETGTYSWSARLGTERDRCVTRKEVRTSSASHTRSPGLVPAGEGRRQWRARPTERRTGLRSCLSGRQELNLRALDPETSAAGPWLVPQVRRCRGSAAASARGRYQSLPGWAGDDVDPPVGRRPRSCRPGGRKVRADILRRP
jgi:hypothetical protein